MRQLLIRAVALLRRPAVIIAVLLMAGGGTALVFVPLFGVPGYELGEALALAVGVLGAIPALASAFQERRLIQGRDPRPQGALRSDGALGSAARALGAAFLLNVVVLVPPFLTARSQRAEMIGGIDLETIVVLGEIARGMKRCDEHRVVLANAFHQSAAFARECCAGFARDPFTQSIGKKNRRRPGLFGTIRPMRWPSLALKI